MTARGFGITTAVFFAALFLGIGVYQPFFPLWLQSRGLNATEIAMVMAAPMVRIVAAPAIAFLADRLGERRKPIIILCGLALACFAAYTFVAGFWRIMIVSILMAIVWPSIIPLAEAAAVGGSHDRGIDYGRIRLWGSLAFIAGSLVTGMAVGLWTATTVLWLLIATQVVALAVAITLPAMPAERTSDDGGIPTPVVSRVTLADVGRLVRGRAFVLMLVVTGLTQAAHALYYAFGAIHWRSLAIDEGIIGLLWSVGVLGEVILFAFSGRAVATFGPVGLIVLGSAAAALRWAVMAHDPPLGVLFAAQVLHGLSFGATHLGTVHFIFRAVPRSLQATAQGFHSAVASGILLSGTVALSGPAYSALGGQAYLLMCVMAVVATACALVLSRMWPGLSPTGRPPADT
jgi:MFS transporter, PPP family, 3-phenylpropionic acid transporter